MSHAEKQRRRGQSGRNQVDKAFPSQTDQQMFRDAFSDIKPEPVFDFAAPTAAWIAKFRRCLEHPERFPAYKAEQKKLKGRLLVLTGVGEPGFGELAKLVFNFTEATHPSSPSQAFSNMQTAALNIKDRLLVQKAKIRKTAARFCAARQIDVDMQTAIGDYDAANHHEEQQRRCRRWESEEIERLDDAIPSCKAQPYAGKQQFNLSLRYLYLGICVKFGTRDMYSLMEHILNSGYRAWGSETRMTSENIRKRIKRLHSKFK